MAKPNYRHAKKQREAAKKARQDAKQLRKAAAPEGAVDAGAAEPPADVAPVKTGA